ncbi:uridine kinase [Tessaracoccus sp. SD287]|uniref:uridine kinase family protein n=1 Tax=Tessaracoccus sp. SD287 TaxID=2782008 RepID=UPI001F61263A|nr:uridine kinase [Tessaracoccus sp. SD287]
MSPVPATCTIILVAGPSGSGKSRLSGQTGVPQVRLDDFYFDDDHPDMPVIELSGGVRMIDWDDRASWNLDAAVTALREISRRGSATVPSYEIAANRAVGTHVFDAGDSPAVICEGIFAIDLVEPLREAGVEVAAIWLDRPRWFNFARRLQRDLRERRKPPVVLVRRGLALLGQEPALRRSALAAGFSPLGMNAAAARIHRILGEQPPAAGR